MIVADSYPDACVDRGISIMRKVLGYTDPLPEGWQAGGKLSSTIPDMLPLAFPDHDITVWHSDRGQEGIDGLNGRMDWEYMSFVTPDHMSYFNLRSGKWKYGGSYVPKISADANNCLTAFCYEVDSSTAHFVIGDQGSLTLTLSNQPNRLEISQPTASHSSQRNDPGLNIAMYANITTDDLLEQIRAIEGIKHTETFIVLKEHIR